MCTSKKHNSSRKKNRSTRSISHVTIYCDETTMGQRGKNGWGLLIIPDKVIVSQGSRQSDEIEPRSELLSRIRELRKDTKYHHEFHLNGISGRKPQPEDRVHWRFMTIAKKAVAPRALAMRSPYMGCKVVTAEYNNCSRLDLYEGRRKESKVRYHESVLRNLIKSALHYFYSERHRVFLHRIVCDESPFYRDISRKQIVDRMLNDGFYNGKWLEDWVQISPQCKLCHFESDHRKYKKGGREYEDAQLLQLTDMTIGAVNYVHSKPNIITERKRRDWVVLPIRQLMDATPPVHDLDFRWYSVSTVEHTGIVRRFRNPPRAN